MGNTNKKNRSEKAYFKLDLMRLYHPAGRKVSINQQRVEVNETLKVKSKPPKG